MKDQRSRGRRSSKAAALAALLQEDYTMKTERLGISLPLQVPQMDQRVISLTWILISVALLVSCTTSFSTFDQALPLLKGQNINQSMDYLGIPDRKYQIDDREIYVWSTSEDFTSIEPVTSNTYGYAGTTPFSAYSTSYESNTSRLSCEIKMSTRDQIVERIEYSGNNGTCFTYSELLKPLLSSK